MGYYSVLNYDINDAFINKAKEQELIKEIKESCNTGFKKVELIIDKNGKLTDICLDGYDRKFYDDDVFANVISKYITAGSVYLSFTGEDGDKWAYTIYPNMVIEGDIFEKENAVFLLKEIKKGNFPDNVKNDILNSIKAYWEEQVNIGQNILNNINDLTNNGKYKVIVPVEEKRKVVCDYIMYCDTKNDAKELVDYIKNEGLVGVNIDEVEDIDVIDSWDIQFNSDVLKIEKNNF